MQNSDFIRLSKKFIDGAIDVQGGERVWIEYTGATTEKLARYCMDRGEQLGGHVRLIDCGSAAMNAYLGGAPSESDMITFNPQGWAFCAA